MAHFKLIIAGISALDERFSLRILGGSRGKLNDLLVGVYSTAIRGAGIELFKLFLESEKGIIENIYLEILPI